MTARFHHSASLALIGIAGLMVVAVSGCGDEEENHDSIAVDESVSDEIDIVIQGLLWLDDAGGCSNECELVSVEESSDPVAFSYEATWCVVFQHPEEDEYHTGFVGRDGLLYEWIESAEEEAFLRAGCGNYESRL
ncbi:hypothetical protein [Glycomyces artemisiae]|uniref:hypothetical protein n=1 Tax=Glycomyces artemisiae TaxID=1076443 RepID=UPI0011B274A0|nr:hypothetical protein [Glycomyces artemisiae]